MEALIWPQSILWTTRSYLAHQTNKLGALAGCCGGSTSVSTLSPYEWSNLGLVKLKGLESIQLDVVKVAGDAFDMGKNAQDDEWETTKNTSSLSPRVKSTGHPNCSPAVFPTFRIATSSKQLF